MHYKDILFIEASNVSIKTCITSLVAESSCQLSHTMVFLNNLSKSIIIEEATILFQVFKWSTNGFLCNSFILNNLIRTNSGKISYEYDIVHDHLIFVDAN